MHKRRIAEENMRQINQNEINFSQKLAQQKQTQLQKANEKLIISSESGRMVMKELVKQVHDKMLN